MPPVAEKTSGVKEARSISRTRCSYSRTLARSWRRYRYVVPIGEVTYERAKGLNTLISNNARSSTVYFCLRMREKMASAELGVVRLGVSGFDKEFADWCREELNCFLLGQVTARGWYVQGSCLSVGQAHSLLCVNFPRCFSARLQIEKAGRWASTAALQSVHCRINGLLTCRDFSDFPLWKNVDMDTSQKSVFARLGWIPHLCCAGGCDCQPSQMAEKGLPVDQSFLQPRWLRCGGNAPRISRSEVLGDFCCSLPDEGAQGNLFLCFYFPHTQPKYE